MDNTPEHATDIPIGGGHKNDEFARTLDNAQADLKNKARDAAASAGFPALPTRADLMTPGAKPKARLMTRAEILATPDREYRVVDVSKWWGAGMSVRVRSLSAGERDQWEASHVRQGKKGGDMTINIQTVRASLVALSLVDDTGALLFSSDEVGILQTKHAAAIDEIYTTCAQMNGVTDTDIEELAGN